MDVSFFDEVPFYSQPDLSSSPSLPSHPAQSSTRTSTSSVPFQVLDLPQPPTQQFAEPPIVYSRCIQDHSLPPVPSNPVQNSQILLLSIPADLRMTPSLIQAHPLLLLPKQVWHLILPMFWCTAHLNSVLQQTYQSLAWSKMEAGYGRGNCRPQPKEDLGAGWRSCWQESHWM